MGEYDIRNELDALDRAFGTGSSASLGSFGSFEMPLTPYTGLDDESPKVPTVADIEMGGTPNSFKNLPELPKREHGIVNSERPCFVSPAEPAPEPIADIHAPPDKSNKFKPLLIATSKRFLSPTAKVSPDEAPLPTLELLDTLQSIAIAVHYEILRNSKKRRLKNDEVLRHDMHPVLLPNIVESPSSADLFSFLQRVFQLAELGAECALITMVYIRRLTSTGIDLQQNNWIRVLLGAILLASKVWDDNAVWNSDFCKVIFPDMAISDMNTLERWYLARLSFEVQVTPPEYAACFAQTKELVGKVGAKAGKQDAYQGAGMLGRIERIGARILGRPQSSPTTIPPLKFSILPRRSLLLKQPSLISSTVSSPAIRKSGGSTPTNPFRRAISEVMRNVGNKGSMAPL